MFSDDLLKELNQAISGRNKPSSKEKIDSEKTPAKLSSVSQQNETEVDLNKALTSLKDLADKSQDPTTIWLAVDDYPVLDSAFGGDQFSSLLGDIAGLDYKGTSQDAVLELSTAFYTKNACAPSELTIQLLQELFGKLLSTTDVKNSLNINLELEAQLNEINLKFTTWENMGIWH